MRRAILLSHQSIVERVFRVGCVIVNIAENEIATGYTGEKESFHAEEVALYKLTGQERETSGGTLYSTLESYHPRLSGKPSCTEYIIRFGITRVVYALAEPPLFITCLGTQVLREAGVVVNIFSFYAPEVIAVNTHLII